MQKFTKLMCAMLALCMLAGCNASVEEETSSSSATSSAATSTTTVVVTTVSETSSSSSSSAGFTNVADSELYQAYYTLLYMVKEGHRLPDGFGELEYDECSSEENEFIVSDVDLDGVDEVVLVWRTCAPESQAAYVFEYETDTDTWNLELQTVSAPEFYVNGICEVFYSDPSGFYDTYNPYLIYSYSAESDSFTEAGSVSALEKTECENNGGDFPYSYDTDSSGVVFMIDYEGYTEPYYSLDDYLDFLGDLQGEYLPCPYMELTDVNLVNEFTDR